MDKMNEAVGLLMIVDKARQWPRLQPLHDMAMQRLEALQTAMTQGESPQARWGVPSFEGADRHE